VKQNKQLSACQDNDILSEFAHLLFVTFICIISALDVDDNEPPLPFQRPHVAQPGRFRQADLPRPVVDISGQRPHVAQPDYVRQSDLPQRAVDINGQFGLRYTCADVWHNFCYL